ncbi:DUF6884 domain-containing protein [Leptolyngbya sp. AN03gr2]|uniref:DUF6884 domain-containing protein n=1 Tax=unclassified Leptolyngbya TaxID=2650499 RepID=UPI003D31ABEA
MNKTILLACVSKKIVLPQDAKVEAKALYCSTWFQLAKAYAENQRCDWFILSAKHGLIKPADAITPYNQSLVKQTKTHRMEWAKRVHQQIVQTVAKHQLLEILAGMRYREFLDPLLTRSGYKVIVPMKGLGIGAQQRWLKLNSQVIVPENSK